MYSLGQALLREIGGNLRDLLPIVCVVALFQVLVIGEPPADLERRLVGLVLVLFGMTFFVRGLSMSIFPLGEQMADGLARRGSVPLLLAFGFALGFGSTIAEPALAAVASQAAGAAASAGAIGAGETASASFALRCAAAGGVGLAVCLGVLRIVMGWPVAWLVLPGYGVATILALAGPAEATGLAFDAGAAATSAINIPLMLALGTGLASMIRGRNPLVDGFGMVAMASLAPVLIVLSAALLLT